MITSVVIPHYASEMNPHPQRALGAGLNINTHGRRLSAKEMSTRYFLWHWRKGGDCLYALSTLSVFL